MKLKSVTPYAATAAVLASTVGMLFATADMTLPLNLIAPASAAGVIDGTTKDTATVVVYSDFQCPACKRFAPRMKQLENRFGESVKVEFKNFPLPQHKNAPLAAAAAEAARMQGKFAEMHDMLFANQQQWASVADPHSVFSGFAKNLGLDAQKFEADSQSDAVAQKIAADMQNAVKDGLNQTPTVFVNGKSVTGKGLAQLEQIIDASLIKPAKS
jgi:protein-disulfide isomerase